MNLMLGWECLRYEFMYSSFLSNQQTSMAFVRNVTAETEILGFGGLQSVDQPEPRQSFPELREEENRRGSEIILELGVFLKDEPCILCHPPHFQGGVQERNSGGTGNLRGVGSCACLLTGTLSFPSCLSDSRTVEGFLCP